MLCLHWPIRNNPAVLIKQSRRPASRIHSRHNSGLLGSIGLLFPCLGSCCIIPMRLLSGVMLPAGGISGFDLLSLGFCGGCTGGWCCRCRDLCTRFQVRPYYHHPIHLHYRRCYYRRNLTTNKKNWSPDLYFRRQSLNLLLNLNFVSKFQHYY